MFRNWSAIYILCFCSVALSGCATTESFDVLIVNGTVVDGSGNPGHLGDVGIVDGKIASIGKLSNAEAPKRIDATGMVVAPGFIDVHNHAERGLVDPELKENEGFITQGVTTCVFGADGILSPQSIQSIIETFEKQGVGTHYAFLAGHNAIRRQVMRMEDRAPTAQELETMQSLVREAMAMGALGFSTGLMYLPGRYASTEEVIELAKVAAEYDGIYDSHVRQAASDFKGSYQECIEIGERSGARPHPAHFKAVGKRNWGQAEALCNYFQARIDSGVDITIDQYPYDGAATAQLIEVFATPPSLGLDKIDRRLRNARLSPEQRRTLIEEGTQALLDALGDPKRREAIQHATEKGLPGVFSWVVAAGGKYDSFRIVASEKHPELMGKMIVDIADEREVSPFQLLVDLVAAGGAMTKITLAACSEEDVRHIMRRSWTMIASDGSITGLDHGQGHPRSRGTFPRVLGRYVREWKILTLEDAVRKMTSLPAAYYRLADRGFIREGYRADVTVFDPDTVIDRSTWSEPGLFSEGIVHVLLNGELALENGEMTGGCHGQLLRSAEASQPIGRSRRERLRTLPATSRGARCLLNRT